MEIQRYRNLRVHAHTVQLTRVKGRSNSGWSGGCRTEEVRLSSERRRLLQSEEDTRTVNGQERGVGTGKPGRNDGGRSTGGLGTIRAARDDNRGNGEGIVKAKAKAVKGKTTMQLGTELVEFKYRRAKIE